MICWFFFTSQLSIDFSFPLHGLTLLFHKSCVLDLLVVAGLFFLKKKVEIFRKALQFLFYIELLSNVVLNIFVLSGIIWFPFNFLFKPIFQFFTHIYLFNLTESIYVKMAFCNKIFTYFSYVLWELKIHFHEFYV